MKVNTIIVGAGQAGLSVSFCLTKKGIDHLVLEKGKVAEGWHSNRWDSFRLITPNYMTKLPGFSYKGENPNGFDTKDQMIQFFDNYAKLFRAPVKEYTHVSSVTKTKGSFKVVTNKGTFAAKNVVVAIGSFHKQLIPQLSKSLPKHIAQLHSSQFRNASQLPKGAVLVAGGGNSGVQITTDLRKAKRKVYLSVGRLRIVPRMYRGKDFMEWAKLLGILDRTTDQATPEVKRTTPPLLFGTPETVNLRKLMKDGIHMLGRMTGFQNEKLLFADDFLHHLQQGEAAFSGFKKMVDDYIAKTGMKAPKEKQEPTIKNSQKPLLELDIKEITSVIWATGFVDDYSWLNVDVFDTEGKPIHTKGISKIPGLYFIGLQWLSKYQSFLLCGIAEDAEYIASQIT